MISNITLLHTPLISLGWLDDSMKLSGPSEEDTHFQLDTGFSNETMADLVDAYKTSMQQLEVEVVKKGGFTWQMMRGNGPGVRNTTSRNAKHPGVNVTYEQCVKTLREYCVPKPAAWDYVAKYEIQPDVAVSEGESLTAEFLLTRGPFAFIGYGWVGCTKGAVQRPFPMEWGRDYGMPRAPCKESGKDTGVFQRSWTKADVQWDCRGALGTITMKK
jgi:hypothetical protein